MCTPYQVARTARFPIRLTGMALVNSFYNSQSNGGIDNATVASAARGGAVGGATWRQTIIGIAGGSAHIARRLVRRLMKDAGLDYVPSSQLPVPIDDLRIKPDYPALIAALKKCEFKSLLLEVESEAAKLGTAEQGNLL